MNAVSSLSSKYLFWWEGASCFVNKIIENLRKGFVSFKKKEMIRTNDIFRTMTKCLLKIALWYSIFLSSNEFKPNIQMIEFIIIFSKIVVKVNNSSWE